MELTRSDCLREVISASNPGKGFMRVKAPSVIVSQKYLLFTFVNSSLSNTHSAFQRYE